jgi:hypothetical protein
MWHILPEGPVTASPLQVVLAGGCDQADVDWMAAALPAGDRATSICCCFCCAAGHVRQLDNISRQDAGCCIIQDALCPYPRHLQGVLSMQASQRHRVSTRTKADLQSQCKINL